MNRCAAAFALVLVGILVFVLSGCGRPAGDAPPTTATSNDGDHDHSDWWCGEHGVPEGVCGQCNPKLAAEFQKKGDWCQEHDRPDSQCFVCHPELAAKFAAQYEAKFGQPPPKVQ